eukprot:Hpha_TRINITY_DN15564_c3_g11::TRINITY_DN15564_c3_g11_i1::g.107870::m.107870
MGQDDVQDVFVDGPIPEELVAGLERDFTDTESILIRHKLNLSTAEENNEVPKCLWVVGPSAVGKSTITTVKAAELFGDEENAVIIDGALLRECHGGWKEVVSDGFNRQPKPLIHKKAWDTLKSSGVLDRRKTAVLEEAIERKMHLIIPDTAQKMEKVLKKVEKLEKAGYEQHLICLWAPRKDVYKRGTARQCKEGKTFSMRGYVDSMRSAYGLAQYFCEKYDAKHRCTIMTTDRFPNMILKMSELKDLADEAARELTPEQETANQLRRRLQHAGKRAGIASRFKDGRAAVKIQALFRGGRTRKEVEKRTGYSPKRSPASSMSQPSPLASSKQQGEFILSPPLASDASPPKPVAAEDVSPARIVRGAAPESGARHRIATRLAEIQDDLDRAKASIAGGTRESDTQCSQALASIQRTAEALCLSLQFLDQQTAQQQHRRGGSPVGVYATPPTVVSPISPPGTDPRFHHSGYSGGARSPPHR